MHIQISDLYNCYQNIATANCLALSKSDDRSKNILSNLFLIVEDAEEIRIKLPFPQRSFYRPCLTLQGKGGSVRDPLLVREWSKDLDLEAC